MALSGGGGALEGASRGGQRYRLRDMERRGRAGSGLICALLKADAARVDTVVHKYVAAWPVPSCSRLDGAAEHWTHLARLISKRVVMLVCECPLGMPRYNMFHVRCSHMRQPRARYEQW
jgi:hypothetical protein